PVPATYLLCEAPEVIGAPFYVMQRLSGTAYRRAADLRRLGPERTRGISARLIDTLVALHRVEPASVGLADFGRGEGFLQRQVRRWRKQLDASWSREIPGIVELHRYLEAHIPSRSEVTIVHGDVRLDNVLVDTEAAHDPITGVLDWEMATLGDPLADVALMLAYSEAAARTGSGLVSDAPLAPGYLSGDQTLQRYAERSGRDLSVM